MAIRHTGGSGRDGVRETVVQGVRTVLAARPGPVGAGLFFRVGRADETLATSGLTHLVEHLALYESGLGEGHYNGATAASYTHFHVQGGERDVVAYLNGVCAALADLPFPRLETEKEILRTEEAGRGAGANRRLPLWRYGARGYGLVSYPEMGLPRLDAATVQSWVRTWFTRENAVLWITADEVPAGLDLSPLPSGTWYGTPAVTSALPQSPAYLEGDEGGVVLDTVVRRSGAATLYAELLGRELFRDLRKKGGYSYTAAADYSPRDADHATVTALADALPDKQDAVLGGFVDVLARMRVGTLAQEDLAAVRESALAVLDIPDVGAARLPSYALNLLHGHRNQSVADLRRELDRVTLRDVRAVAEEAAAAALLQVPRGRDAEWAGFVQAPVSSLDVVNGERYPAVAEDGVWLVVGPDGVSLVTPGGAATVRFAQCALMAAVPDGARRLTGYDGIALAVEPTLFRMPIELIASIDRMVPPECVVREPPRAAADIPQPAKTRQSSGFFGRRR
ncbi:insulinase family protein [Streptomyces sp. NPDC051940]|uniref:insulinase family protein n=1 Tax=Streptomyces sp. NPDC051940 TaxID=3155675 RepID=UPI00341E8D5E